MVITRPATPLDFHFLFYFVWEATPGGAQGLLLALHSGIAPSRALGTRWGATGIGLKSATSKASSLLTITLATSGLPEVFIQFPR